MCECYQGFCGRIYTRGSLDFFYGKSKEGLPGMPLLKKLAAVFYICYSSFAVRRQSAFLSIQFQAFRRYILKD